jgi:CubicO group peptidase (beta-lactamase class C family)
MLMRLSLTEDRMKKNKIFNLVLYIAALSVGSLAIWGQTAPQPDVPGKVDEYMNAVWNVKKVGGSVLVAKGGKVVAQKGYGYANAEAKTANDPTLRYRIGSLTKQFTAAGILLLQEKGKLNVRDNACKYIDNCPGAWQPITIHQLLTHTSGIFNITTLPDWPTKKKEDLTTVQVVDLVRQMPLRFSPGSDFEYSNTGYILLGLIIEKASGKQYADFMKASIFDPLKLADSGYDDGKRPATKFVEGYSKRGNDNVLADAINMKAPFAAGSLYSTVGDLYRWSEALNSTKLLSQKSLDAMFTPDKRNYAYGWGVSTLNGRSVHSHTGGIDGFSSYIIRVPTDNSVVIVLLNNTQGMANIVGNDLLAILNGDKYELPKERKVVPVDTKILDSYVGKYDVAPSLSFTIDKEGSSLTFLPPGQPRAVELFAESETSFFLRVVDAQIKFIKDENGKVTGLEFSQMGRVTRARRIE